MKKVISSVPRVSVLGTILFTFFINDLLECLINECEMYAEDNKVMAENEMQIMADNVAGQGKWATGGQKYNS